MVHLLPRKSNLEAENPHDSQRNTKSRCIESIEQIIALMWRLRAIAAISWITAPVAGLIHAVIDELHHDRIVYRPWVRGIGSRRRKWNPSWSCRSCGWCPLPRFWSRSWTRRFAWRAQHMYYASISFASQGQALLPPTSSATAIWLPSWFPSNFPQPLDPQKSHRKNEGWKIPIEIWVITL